MPSVCALRDKLVLIALVLCAICLAPAAFARNTPRFDPIQCPDDFPQLTNARCGYLVVPEDRSQPSGRTIQLFAQSSRLNRATRHPIRLSTWGQVLAASRSVKLTL